jgi:uncharacterized membrane protein YbhN (UPF0104 family)
LLTARKRWIKVWLQLIILALVAWGIVGSVRKSASQLSRQRQTLTEQASELRRQADSLDVEGDVASADALRKRAEEAERSVRNFWRADPTGLVLAGLIYGLGMVPGSLFWRQCLRALDQPTQLLTILWAYFYGNLGKYFPGKAMVIVLRLGALEPLGIKRMATSITIFMETLTMMSVGGAMAGLCMIALNIDWRLTLLSVGLLCVTFVPTFPPILRRLIPKLQRGVDPQVLRVWTERIQGKLFVRGWGLLSLTWLAFGLSLWLVLRSLPIADFTHTTALTLLLSCCGACALAVVLGFVSLLPGGAGVREAVLSIVLTPVVGPVAALCGAIWLRVVWLATELLIVGILFVIRRAQPN